MDKEKDSSEELEWTRVGPNNLLLNSLKDLTKQYTRSVELEVRQAQKDIEKAKKVFYGR